MGEVMRRMANRFGFGPEGFDDEDFEDDGW
jgi:hypothetical protein